MRHLGPKEREMAHVIFISSKMILFHANDLLDQRFIQDGHFVPAYASGSVTAAVLEVVHVVQMMQMDREIDIQCDVTYMEQNFPLL